ncbi:acyl carrier protein [Streptomyces sp. NPDC091371]|uniref:acyl carrier protein n=1 Tax=Streptomyces sp. NPDC091371 TaxID=3155303 RepID=UPI003415310A
MSQSPSPVEIRQWLTGHIAALLEVAPQDIDPDTPLDALGVTSMEEVIITADLEARYGVALPLADMRRHPTIEALSTHITGHTAAHGAGQAPPTPAPVPQADGTPAHESGTDGISSDTLPR